MQKNNRTPAAKSKQQKVWEYMRRNRTFKVEDILLLINISDSSLRIFVGHLGRNGYLKQVKANHRFVERSYRLIKNTGVKAPRWIERQKRLYDINTEKPLPRDPTQKIPATINAASPLRPITGLEYAESRLKIVLLREKRLLREEELAELAGLSGEQAVTALASLLYKREVCSEDNHFWISPQIKEPKCQMHQ